MYTKIKQRQLERLREDRLTRHVCPGVPTEDWILACVYRDPRRLIREIKEVKPEFLRTPTGQKLFSQLRLKGCFPSLTRVDYMYRNQARTEPERAQEARSMRDHIARLRRIPRSTTPGEGEFSTIVRDWCADRRKALSPYRKLPTRELELELGKQEQDLLLVSQEIEKVNQIRKPLMDTARAQEVAIRDLLELLVDRTDRHIDADETRKALDLSNGVMGLRQRLMQRVHDA